MKIMHIDFGMEWRGGQRQAITLHNELLKNGVVSYFVVIEGSHIARNKSKVNNLFIIPSGALNVIMQLRSIARQLQPDIIHSHDSRSMSYTALIKSKKFKIVHTRRVIYKIGDISAKFKYSKADIITAVSNEIRDYLLTFFSNVITIPSCIDNERFNKKSELPPYKKIFEKNIVFVGAMSRQKGVDILLKAAAAIGKRNIGFHIVGDGAFIKDYFKLAESLMLEENVLFYGRRNDVEDFYQHADLVVVPSVDGEGSSGTIKEGMAAGKVVIASDLGGNKEIITDGKNGILFNSGDFQDLADKISSFFNKKYNISSQQISDTVEKYSKKNYLTQYLDLYKKILDNG